MGVIDCFRDRARDRTRFLYLTLNITNPSTTVKMAKKDMKKKTKKSTSNVFSMFEQQQIQEFKEAFQMIDADRNGIITVGDLKATYASLGVRNVDQDELEKMTAEAGAPSTSPSSSVCSLTSSTAPTPRTSSSRPSRSSTPKTRASSTRTTSAPSSRPTLTGSTTRRSSRCSLLLSPTRRAWLTTRPSATPSPTVLPLMMRKRSKFEAPGRKQVAGFNDSDIRKINRWISSSKKK